ncbi:MAG: DUF5615 family PIN-like protein [Candidatus Kariarchaeaceae archaeon]
MKFLVDMALSPKTVQFLINNGFEAVRVSQVIPKIADIPIEDEAIFNYAIENNLFIITFDLDFGEILAFTKSSKPSTIIIRSDDQQVHFVNNLLLSAIPRIQNELVEGSIKIIEKHRLRIRKLPL